MEKPKTIQSRQKFCLFKEQTLKKRKLFLTILAAGIAEKDMRLITYELKIIDNYGNKKTQNTV